MYLDLMSMYENVRETYAHGESKAVTELLPSGLSTQLKPPQMSTTWAGDDVLKAAESLFFIDPSHSEYIIIPDLYIHVYA